MKTFLDFKSELQADKVRNVYYIAASDGFFISKACELLREKLFGSKDNKDNFFLRYADETPMQEIIDLSNNFASLFSQKKIIVIKRCEKYSRKMSDLLDFLEKPMVDSIILAVFESDFVWEKKLTDNKSLSDNFYDFSDLPKKELTAWVKSEFESRGVTIEQDELELFISSVPLSFDLLYSEIEKISNYDFESSEKIVTQELILKSIGYDKEYSPEELIHNIITKNPKRALEILDNLINSKSLNEIYLLSIMSNYYMDLITFKTKGLENADNSVVYGKYKMWGARARFAKNYHKSLNLKSLETSFALILSTDMKLKTTMLDSKILVTSLVEELINA